MEYLLYEIKLLMLPELESLLILQERDVKKFRLLKEIEQFPAQEAQIKQRLEEQSKGLEILKLRSKQVESERKDLENQVQSKKSQIAKYQTQQFETKKNEEYQALGHEIERTKKEILEIEDKELVLMEAYEKSLSEVKKEQEAVNAANAAQNERLDNIKKRVDTMKQQVTELESEITGLESKIDGTLLSRYRRVLKSKGDLALVPVVNETTCGGCHVKLTHQTVISAKGGKLTSCENCGRFIFWQHP